MKAQKFSTSPSLGPSWRSYAPRSPAANGGACAKRNVDKSRFRVVRAAPAATSDALLTKEDLVNYLSSGCKPKSDWRIGTEHEKFVIVKEDKTRAQYSHIKEVLYGLVKRFGWEPIKEGENIIGVKLDGQSVTLEPSGQFELSGAPVANLHQTCGEVNSHLYQVKSIAEPLGLEFLGVGMDPRTELKDCPKMPKARYGLMRSYMPKVGTLGLDMMTRTCTIQVNLDFESEKDMIEKFRIGLALQPVASALFANSPFKEGKPSGYLSWRNQIWTDVDSDRSGNLPFVFDDNFGFEKYVDYAMSVPMYFVYRNGEYKDALGLSWHDFMEGKLPGFEGDYPTMDDWENHLTTVFPEVRLKRFLEMRGADGGPWKLICALPALWVGLLYDEQAQSDALDLIQDWTQEDRDYLLAENCKQGLRTPFKGGTMLDLAKQVLKISKEGLERRGYEEASFLAALENNVSTGKSSADVLLDRYHNVWGESVLPIYDELQY
ncbi:hypothetical protein BSKO_03479 [Bryopsis sp. KO-2023]|nr:hypothetical protein BSKO_03479 [Bryopsis sp. KO-2023]